MLQAKEAIFALKGEGFQAAFGELVRGSALVPLLLEAVRSSHAGVRQAAFALAGELAKRDAVIDQCVRTGQVGYRGESMSRCL